MSWFSSLNIFFYSYIFFIIYWILLMIVRIQSFLKFQFSWMVRCYKFLHYICRKWSLILVFFSKSRMACFECNYLNFSNFFRKHYFLQNLLDLKLKFSLIIAFYHYFYSKLSNFLYPLYAKWAGSICYFFYYNLKASF